MTEEWGLSIRVIAPDGTLADFDAKSGSNWTRGTLSGEVFFCSSDSPGTYTLTGTFTTWPGDVKTTLPSLAFQLLPVPVIDVVGTVVKAIKKDGVKLTFRTEALPLGHVQGKPSVWKITHDGRTKRVIQNADERDTLRLQFKPYTGKHVIRVYRNNVGVLRTVVRTRLDAAGNGRPRESPAN